MKEKIKQILREGSEKNSLGVVVTRPDQELIVMRGISGAGKSTKAKSIVGEGVIHSTDEVIEKTGDYRGFFEKMLKENNFAPLSKAHLQNLNESVASMKAGVSPVVVDNTNIKMNEPKAYVIEALKLGYADHNIRFVDVGTSGLSAEELASRNAHGVPLDKIKKMMASHKSQGEMTLNKVLESKDMYKPSFVLYSAVVMDEASHEKLLTRFSDDIPEGWKPLAHHMTIVFGKGLEDKNELGKEVVLKVTHLGKSDMALAVRVDGYPSKNDIPHVTIAVSPSGKPVMSNDIRDWEEIKPFFINGVVTEIKK